jgi:adenylylsulfate kinase
VKSYRTSVQLNSRYLRLSLVSICKIFITLLDAINIIMSFKILIMGLSGSGKTTLASELIPILKTHKSVSWINADAIRNKSNDWDFSETGRIRQTVRMNKLAESATTELVVCDFIAPLLESRRVFNADYIIWMDTTNSSQYKDTDGVFIPPQEYNYRITDFSTIDTDITRITNSILGIRNTFNVLKNTQIPEFAFERRIFSGSDAVGQCVDVRHFANYKKEIIYKYNSRGFRDDEWPTKKLDECVWCFGDSFTVGLGQPQHETWPSILSNKLQHPTINISLDGASADWITRQVISVLKEIQPKNIIIQWSYLHRREHDDDTLSDNSRRLWSSSTVEDIDNFLENISTINHANVTTNIIHSWIPHATENVDKLNVLLKILNHNGINLNHTTFNTQVDFSRDRHHYDILTSNRYVDEYLNLINS